MKQALTCVKCGGCCGDIMVGVVRYRNEELPVRPVNIKRRKLSKLERHDAIWTYATPGMDLNIIDFLKKRWSLDYSA